MRMSNVDEKNEKRLAFIKLYAPLLGVEKRNSRAFFDEFYLA